MDLRQAKAEIDKLKRTGVANGDIADLISKWNLNGDEEAALQHLKDWKPPKNKLDWRAEVQSYADLMAKEIAPIHFLIDQVLARPGLGVIAGKKKTGKSYLLLDGAIAVSQGKEFLGLKTIKARVVYFALEDGERRIKQRLLQKRAPQGLDIYFIYKWQALNTDLGRKHFIEMIENFKPGLIAIDTLASSKNRLIDENDNNAMADFINWIHTVAITYDISILIVAHHGKRSTGEPGFDIRGASATPGATDVNIGLYKKNGFSDLVIEGRDIPSLELSIIWENFVWTLRGNANELRRQDAEDKIREALKILVRGEASQIAKIANLTRATVQSHLERMREEHKVDYEPVVIKNTPHIQYYLPQGPNTPTPHQPHHPNTLAGKGGDGELTERSQHPQSESKTGVDVGAVGVMGHMTSLASKIENLGGIPQ